MSTIVLCSHLPGAGHFRSKRFRVVSLPCVRDDDYCRGWQAIWDTDATICNIEHDHDPTDDLIQTLLDCPHPMCSWAYVLHQPSTGGRQHYAHRSGKSPTAGGDWIAEGREWADFGGIGFCKIVREVRVRPLEDVTWQFVDCAIRNATDARWHIHWQDGPDGPTGVPHHHVE